MEDSEGGWDCVVLSWLHVVGVEKGDAEGERVPGNLVLEEKLRGRAERKSLS